MKSFDKFLGITALVLFVVLMVSGMIGVSYIIGHPGMFNSANFSVDDDFYFSFSDRRSSDYPTLTMSQQDNYQVSEVNAIKLDVAFADVILVEEERDDIMVKHYIEYPDTTNYSYDYNCMLNGDTINIRSNVRSYNLHMDINYDQYISIYIPNDMNLDVYELTSSIGVINNDSIPANVNYLYLTADLGDININLDHPLEGLTLRADIGEVYAQTSKDINALEISSPIGLVSFSSSARIDTLEIDSAIGDVFLVLQDLTEYGDIELDVSSADITIYGQVEDLNVDGNIGDINLSVSSGNTVYVDSEDSSVSTEINLSDEDDANIDISTDIGVINVYELHASDSVE